MKCSLQTGKTFDLFCISTGKSNEMFLFPSPFIPPVLLVDSIYNLVFCFSFFNSLSKSLLNTKFSSYPSLLFLMFGCVPVICKGIKLTVFDVAVNEQPRTHSLEARGMKHKMKFYVFYKDGSRAVCRVSLSF